MIYQVGVALFVIAGWEAGRRPNPTATYPSVDATQPRDVPSTLTPNRTPNVRETGHQHNTRLRRC